MMRRERLSSRFPHRVWSVATTDATGSIGFDATGELLLLDGERFNANYIGQSVFLRCKLPSFIAQLYGHGWRKSHEDIAEGLPNGRSPHFLRAFRHPSFHRNQPELLGEIRASFNDKKLKRQKIEGNIRRTSVDAIYNTELSDGSDDNNNLSDEAISTSEPRPKRKIRHVPTQVSNSYR